MKSKLFASVLACLVTALSVRGEILLVDGFPTGEGGYSTAKATVTNFKPTGSSIIGFADEAYSGQNFVYTFGSNQGLSFPTSFSSIVPAGDSAIGFQDSNSTKANRTSYRKLAASVIGLTSGKFYIRLLMQADATALDKLEGGDNLALVSYYAAGLNGSSYYSTAGQFGDAIKSRTYLYDLAFGYVKNGAGSVSISLIARGAGDQIVTCPLVANPTSGNTYIGLIEVDPNAGTDGKEKIRAVVQDVSDYNPAFTFQKLDGDSDTIEVELISADGKGKTLEKFCVDGRLGTGNGIVKFDEFAIATSVEELVYVGAAPQTYTLYIASNIDGLGQPQPPYGKIEDVATDGSVVCTPGEMPFSDGVAYSCTGYTYETRDEQGEWSEPEVRTEKSFVMDDSAQTVRITWQWAPVAYRVAVMTHGSGSESVTFDADPVAPLQDGEGSIGGYFAADEELSVSAVDGAGTDPCEFLSWSGDVESNERTIAVTPSAPLALVANFKTHWKYDSENGTLSDGNWTLTCGAYQDADITVENPLVITGATAGNGVLDLETINSEISGGTVRAIGDAVFKDRTDLVALMLSPSVVYIGKEAFLNSGIANLPDFSHVVEVSDNAFQGCANMKGQPDFSSLATVKNNAFDSTGLSGDLILPELTLATYASFQKAAFTGKIVAPKLASIPQNFAVNLKVTSAEFDSATTVGNTAFSGCSKLASIKLSPNVKTFVSACFNGCSSLVEMDPAPFGPSVETIGYRSFAGTALANMVFGESFVSFDARSATDETSDAFSGSKVQSVDLSATSLAGLRTALFRDCYQLEHVVLPATVNQIDAQVFGAANAVDKLLVVDFAGDVPATVSDQWADNPDNNNGVSRPNRDWKMIIRVKGSRAASWTADPHFVALKDIPDVELKPNYDRLGEFKRVVGAWRNMWLCVDSKGLVITVK